MLNNYYIILEADYTCCASLQPAEACRHLLLRLHPDVTADNVVTGPGVLRDPGNMCQAAGTLCCCRILELRHTLCRIVIRYRCFDTPPTARQALSAVF